jgi:hypothetical protein
MEFKIKYKLLQKCFNNFNFKVLSNSLLAYTFNNKSKLPHTNKTFKYIYLHKKFCIVGIKKKKVNYGVRIMTPHTLSVHFVYVLATNSIKNI